MQRLFSGRSDPSNRIAFGFPSFSGHLGIKKPQPLGCGWKWQNLKSGFGDQAGFDGLDRDEHALRAAIGELHANALQVRAELALGDAGHVRADAAALLGLTLTVDAAALNGTFTGDCANSGHDGFGLVKGRG